MQETVALPKRFLLVFPRTSPLEQIRDVTDDYEGLINSLSGGIRKSAGFRALVTPYEEGGSEIFLWVEYVYADGEAYKSGLKRGDLILAINGVMLTTANLYDLYYQDVIELNLGELQNGQVVDKYSAYHHSGENMVQLHTSKLTSGLYKLMVLFEDEKHIKSFIKVN